MCKTNALLIVALSLGMPFASIADSITYDFTGTVISSTGDYSSAAIGSTVSGTYTINLANADPTQSDGTVGSSTVWTAQVEGGPAVSTSIQPVPPQTGAPVFASTFLGTDISYKSLTIVGAGGSQSFVSGSPAQVNSNPSDPFSPLVNGYIYEANEAVWPNYINDANETFVQSGFYLEGTSLTWSAAGLPLLSSSTSAVGEIEKIIVTNGFNTTADDLMYNITSLSVAPVPLPPGTWLMLSGLVGLTVFARKHRDTSLGVDR